MKCTSNPALKCILNLIWSVRGSINADSKKGNVKKGSKFTVFAATFVTRGDNLRKEKPIKSKQNRRHAEQLPISLLKPVCWLRWRVVGTSFGGWSESEAQSARGHEPMNFFHEYGQ